MQLCAITDRRRLPTRSPDQSNDEAALRQELLALVAGWTAGRVDYIQLREKDLAAPQLKSLVRELTQKLDGSESRLLVNIATPDSAALVIAAGADGVHLAGKPAPGAARAVRQAFRSSGRDGIISVPCHSLEEVELAVQEQVDLLLFSPVFEKLSAPPHGIEGLRRACVAARGIPVFALGGVTPANAAACVAAGATGVAGIRLFAGGDWRPLRYIVG